MNGYKQLPQRAWASIDLSALRNNMRVVRERCPKQNYLPVIKANGYGHGLERIAQELVKDTTGMEGLAVAAISEVQRLRNVGIDIPIVLLPGFVNKAEMKTCLDLGAEPVIHSKYQVDLLKEECPSFSRLWLKVNTGMNRLGLPTNQWKAAFETVTSLLPATNVISMSHLACADDKQSTATMNQVQEFQSVNEKVGGVVRRTLAASGGILAWEDTHCDIVRPGIMLYGSSPLMHKGAAECNLKPVMTFHSRVIAINSVEAGQPIGYGHSFLAEKDMQVGVVSVGYGDGYPRKAPSGTPVLVNSSDGVVRTRLVGRVSMDMITIDLTDIKVDIGAEVILWGKGLPSEEIASACQTISYELFCQVTPRVPRIELSE